MIDHPTNDYANDDDDGDRILSRLSLRHNVLL